MFGSGTAELPYFRDNDLRPSSGIIVCNFGSRVVKILDVNDYSVHKRHVDQVGYKDSGQLSFHCVCTEMLAKIQFQIPMWVLNKISPQEDLPDCNRSP